MLDSLRYKDKDSAGEAMQRAVYAYLSRARHTHEEYENSPRVEDKVTIPLE